MRSSRLLLRAAGMPLLVGLLVVTFAIAADLAHEAWTTSVAQQRTAERAGRDAVRYRATSTAYEARAAIDLALHTLLAPVLTHTAARPPAASALVRSAVHVRDCGCAPAISARYYFRIHSTDGSIDVAGDAAPSDIERRWLLDTLVAEWRTRPRPARDVSLLIGPPGGARRVAGYAPLGGANGASPYVYGFVSDAGAFADAIFASPSPSGGRDLDRARTAANDDSVMRTLVLAPNGEALYDVNPRRPALRVTMVPRAGHESYVPAAAPLPSVTRFADTVPLGARYGDLRLDVALATSETGELSADGVPRSRLFALFGLLLLMAGLVTAAIYQLRREHELVRMRADLTAGVSHELRTPLAQILLFGETLMLERTRSERERRAAAEVIVRETRRLMHLVENALHFTRADRQLLDLTPETVDLGALTREILVGFAPLAWVAKVTVREVIDDPAPALIDGAAYRQIVLNLLENAVRYGPAGQTVTVRVESLAEKVRLVVEDEGPGVPVGDRERIWSPFVRLTSRRAAAGTGIGLAVVRDLTLRHGGRSWVERAERGGARFVVEVPAPSAAGKDSGRDAARIAL